MSTLSNRASSLRPSPLHTTKPLPLQIEPCPPASAWDLTFTRSSASPSRCFSPPFRRPMDLSDLVHGLKPKESRRRPSRDDDDPSSGKRPQQETRRGRSSSSSSPPNERPRRQPHKSRERSPSSSPEKPTSVRVGSSSGSGVLMCELCSRTFQSQEQFDQHTLVFHRRSKVPAKPREATFLCPYCGKAFTSPSKRNVHQNATHMRLRPFQCTVCNKAFGYKGGKSEMPLVVMFLADRHS